MKEDVSIL